MDFTWLQLLIAFLGSSGIIGGGFTLIKFIYEQVDKRRDKQKSAEEKAYEAVWKLYEAAKQEVEKLKKEIEELEKGDSLSRPTLSKIYQAVRKLGRQIEILDSVFIKEFIVQDDDPEKQALKNSIKKEMEILWQKFDELEKCLP